MKSLTVRLPEPLVREIESEAYGRGISKSDVVRERLTRRAAAGPPADPTAVIADLVGSVGGLPADRSAGRKAHLRATGYGEKRPR